MLNFLIFMIYYKSGGSMKFNIYTLGCKVNMYESNVIIDKMKNAGYIEISPNEEADISIINTCTVTNNADSKSRKMINHAIKMNPNAIIIACGCLIQNKKNKEKNNLVKNVENISFEGMTLNNFNKTRAFIKIQDGCNNFCTYCIIPYVRGNVRSKKKEDVLKEVSNLLNNGHKEIVLTGIHTGNYGAEFENYKLSNLLEDLITFDKLERIRISSIEMNEINENIIDIMKKNNKIVLKRMNRKYDKEAFIKKIEEIRKIRPNISITTDVIVGFPEETDE